jgi:hypothetical protein
MLDRDILFALLVALLAVGTVTAVFGDRQGLARHLDDDFADAGTHRIGVIIPFLGAELPTYFSLFAASARGSASLVDWIIPHVGLDVPAHLKLLPNVKFVDLKLLSTMTALFGRTLGRTPSQGKWIAAFLSKELTKMPYMLVNLKPIFGAAFSHILSGYTHWAFGDFDVVVGDLPRFIAAEELAAFDVITLGFRGRPDHFQAYVRGQFTVHRNVPRVNALWRGCTVLKDFRSFALGDTPFRDWLFNVDESCYSDAIARCSWVRAKYAARASADWFGGALLADVPRGPGGSPGSASAGYTRVLIQQAQPPGDFGVLGYVEQHYADAWQWALGVAKEHGRLAAGYFNQGAQLYRPTLTDPACAPYSAGWRRVRDKMAEPLVRRDVSTCDEEWVPGKYRWCVGFADGTPFPDTKYSIELRWGKFYVVPECTPLDENGAKFSLVAFFHAQRYKHEGSWSQDNSAGHQMADDLGMYAKIRGKLNASPGHDDEILGLRVDPSGIAVMTGQLPPAGAPITTPPIADSSLGLREGKNPQIVAPHTVGRWLSLRK